METPTTKYIGLTLVSLEIELQSIHERFSVMAEKGNLIGIERWDMGRWMHKSKTILTAEKLS